MFRKSQECGDGQPKAFDPMEERLETLQCYRQRLFGIRDALREIDQRTHRQKQQVRHAVAKSWAHSPRMRVEDNAGPPG